MPSILKKSYISIPSCICNAPSLFMLIGFVVQISSVLGDDGYYDCVTPMPGIDFPGCFRDIVTADRNGDGYVRRNEYLGFIQEYGKRICWQQDDLTLEQYAAFNTISCWCSTAEGGSPECCLGENAKISVAGALDLGRTETEQEYLTAACVLTDSTMVHNCTPKCTLIDEGPGTEVLVPASGRGSEAFASDSDEEDGFRFLWLLFILAALLLCCCCCCALFRKKSEEETKETKEIIETTEKIEVEPVDTHDLDIPYGDDDKAPSEILPSEDEEQTPRELLSSLDEPRELLVSEDEEQAPSEILPSEDEDRVPSELIPSEDEDQRVPSELIPSEDETLTIPSEILPSEDENQTIPSEILPSEVDDDEEEEDGGGKDGGGDVEEEKSEPPAPPDTNEESSEDEEDGGRRRGGGNVDDDDDEANRRIRGAGELPPDPEPDNEGVSLKPIPDKEPEEVDDWDQMGRDINFDKDKDEISAGEVDHYEPDGGVNIPERPTKDPIDYQNKWEREQAEDPDEIDKRKHRIQAGLGEGKVWDTLNDDDSVRESKEGRRSGTFDWAIQTALGVLDNDDGDETTASHLYDEGSEMGLTQDGDIPPANPPTDPPTDPPASTDT